MNILTTGFLAAMALGLATAASAQGVYGDPDGCRRNSGAGALGDELTILDSQGIQFFESGCSLKNKVPIGARERYFMTCNGEGETWSSAYDVEPLQGRDGYVLWNIETPEYRTEVLRCR